MIFVGAGKTAERALHYFQDDLGYRYHVIGFLDDNPISDKIPDKYKLLGKISEAEKIVENSHVQNVIITVPGMERDKLQQLITTVQPHVRNLSYVPDLIGTPMMGVEAQVLFTEEILMLHLRNNLAMRRNKIYKRIFDLVCTVCGGLIILPIIAVVALLVAIDNKGNVIFAHRRIGKDGKEFPCYKFQSMVPNAQEILQDYLMAAAKYANVRACWNILSREEKMDTDANRTACHNKVILHLNILARYLASKGKDVSWRDELGDDSLHRKKIGDFACYVACIEGLNAR